jgi:protein tyrosine phosphatase
MQSFQVMLEHFICWILESQKDAKAVVHCSAGIGRTGTTVTLAHAIINTHAQLNKGQKPVCSIFSIVRRLREQRFGLVQMPNQFMFIFVFFMQYLKA